jgi:alkylated DNA nucleotide flippase Atl1
VNFAERAAQIWPVLAFAAKHRQVLTYQDVSDVTGMPARGLGFCLEPIQAYCLKHSLPPLTAIVVHGDDGLPGTGFTAAGDVPKAQARVFAYDWRKHPCPSAKVLSAATTGGGDV